MARTECGRRGGGGPATATYHGQVHPGSDTRERISPKGELRDGVTLNCSDQRDMFFCLKQRWTIFQLAPGSQSVLYGLLPCLY